ncbi:hypothetical protein KM043_014517 [Ampulex compressa]|nr:hypothetical protein KM043_014517 [Ampulex compressa]
MEIVMAAASNKLEDCEVCGGEKAKYTCPKCEVRTCCLTCVNIHKKELECDGIRDKTKFIPLKSFSDLDVLNDYRLLEDIGRSVDQLKKDPLKRCTRQRSLPVHLNKLKLASFKRKVNLQFMPQNFSKHKENTTFLNWKTNELYWRIEWIFPQAENTKWVTERALESTRLSTLIEQILDPNAMLEDKIGVDNQNLKLTLNDRLQFYQAAGLCGLKILLKAERVSKSNCRFHELDVTLSIKENLENKTIIEFPTLYVILKDHIDMYEILHSDDEESERKNWSTSKIQSRKRKLTCKNVNEKDNVNYFFNTEFSESDDELHNVQRVSKPTSNINIPCYDALIKMEH